MLESAVGRFLPPNPFGPRKLLAYLLMVASIVVFATVSADLLATTVFAVILFGFMLTGLLLLRLTGAMRRVEVQLKTVGRHEGSVQPIADAPLPRRPKLSSRVSRLANLLHDGYVLDSTTELRELIGNSAASPSERSTAAIVLGWWSIARGDVDEAYGYAEMAHVLQGSLDSADLVALKADALLALGQIDAARVILDLHGSEVPDLMVRRANAESEDRDAEVLRTLNALYAGERLAPLRLADPGERLTLGNLSTDVTPAVDGPRVSVIMPLRNAADSLPYALGSVLAQTWTNLEVIVVDDGSIDESGAIAELISTQDPRVRVISCEPRGAYPARNRGVEECSGEFITVHDADDWSHPQKIELQVRALLASEDAVASVSSMVRVRENVEFVYRGSKAGLSLIGRNTSSLLVRRMVIDQLGSWDQVRVGADGEYVERVIARFGRAALVQVGTGVPLSLCLSTSRSLSTSGPTSVAAQWPTGSRFLYAEAYRAWHRGPTFQSDLPLAVGARAPFPVPTIYSLETEHRSSHEFDVVIITDLSLTGGTYSSTEQELLAQRAAGLRTGLVHLPVVPGAEINRKLWNLVDGHEIELLSYGRHVSSSLVIVRHPGCVNRRNEYVPVIESKHTVVVVNQTPRVSYQPWGREVYSIATCQENLSSMGLAEPVWFPLSPSVRQVLMRHHSKDLEAITLAGEDWNAIIDAAWWRRDGRRISDGVIRLGRHSRDGHGKWPSDDVSLHAAYPTVEPFEVHVLGGAGVPTSMLGQLPSNWRVHEFDALHPRDFLADLDVYVFFTARGVEEAFGRSILEALAAGVPVVAPPEFEPAFGDAVISSAPNEVRFHVERLMSHDEVYDAQVQAGFRFVEEHHSWSVHLARLEPFVTAEQTVGSREKSLATSLGHDAT